MNITRNQFEILSMIEREGGKKITQRQMSKETGLSLGNVNKAFAQVKELGLVSVNESKEVQITKSGLYALEPYRVKRVIIVAAGFGGRMVPITVNTPKPLIRVRGKRIIETILDTVEARGIKEVIIVRGYLKEQFDDLKRLYPNIKFLDNLLFNDANNIASLLLAKDKLSNAYIMDGDLILNNKSLIRKYEYTTNFLGVYEEKTDDWCLEVEKGHVRDTKIGGVNCYRSYGISYWTKEDGVKLKECLEKVWNMPGGKTKFWGQIPLEVCAKEFDVEIRPCAKGDIEEINTFKELKEIDPIYKM